MVAGSILEFVGDAELLGAILFDLLGGVFFANGVVFVVIDEALKLLFEISDQRALSGALIEVL